jgi:hypothetical protein
MTRTHGGRRKGAGRKANPQARRQFIGFRIAPTLAQTLDDYAARFDLTRTAAAEQLLSAVLQEHLLDQALTEAKHLARRQTARRKEVR